MDRDNPGQLYAVASTGWTTKSQIIERIGTALRVEALTSHLKEDGHSILSKIPLQELTAVSQGLYPDPRTSCMICLEAFFATEEFHKHLANPPGTLCGLCFP